MYKTHFYINFLINTCSLYKIRGFILTFSYIRYFVDIHPHLTALTAYCILFVRFPSSSCTAPYPSIFMFYLNIFLKSEFHEEKVWSICISLNPRQKSKHGGKRLSLKKKMIWIWRTKTTLWIINYKINPRHSRKPKCSFYSDCLICNMLKQVLLILKQCLLNKLMFFYSVVTLKPHTYGRP